MRRTVVLTLVALAACGNGANTDPASPAATAETSARSPSSTPLLGAAPWSGGATRASEAAPVLIEQWRAADNRNDCAALHPEGTAATGDAVVRRASFSGGWGIAYDKPGSPGRDMSGNFCRSCGRGVFGVAGTGAKRDASDLAPGRWPFELRWATGGTAGYGGEGSVGDGRVRRASLNPANWNGPVSVEGNTVPWLAYVSIPTQGCLYNVWSFMGKGHLEGLIRSLRFVEGAGATN